MRRIRLSMQSANTRVIALISALTACSDVPDGHSSDISWDDYVAEAYRNEDGVAFYVVEWDLQFSSLDALRRHYDENVASGERFRSIVNHYPADVRDIWDQVTQLELTYCIHSNFGADFELAEVEMEKATHGWEQVANVDFEYLPDATCSPDTYAGVFTVRASSNDVWCSTFPSDPDPPCHGSPRTVEISFDSIEEAGPPWTNQMALRHELGHQLGLRHEQIHSDCGIPEGGDFEELTELDSLSVMGYPGNGGCIEDITLDISELDGVGMRELYGMPAAWYVAAGVI